MVNQSSNCLGILNGHQVKSSAHPDKSEIMLGSKVTLSQPEVELLQNTLRPQKKNNNIIKKNTRVRHVGVKGHTVALKYSTSTKSYQNVV